MIGKIIVVTNEDAVLPRMGGTYGIIIDKSYGDKWMVRFVESMNGKGSMSHTMRECDFRVVGEVTK